MSQCLERGEAAQAEAQLATARAQYPDEDFWGLFLAEIKERLELLRLRAEVARVENSVRDRLERDDPQGAQKELAAGQAKYPNESVWAALQTEIDARLAALQLEAERRDAAAVVRWSLDEGVRRAFQAELEAPVPYPIVQLWDALGKAAARLDEARTKYPGESLWEILRAEIDQRRTQLET